MTTAATYPAAMTELRGDPHHTNFWSNYGGSSHMSSRISSAMDPGFPSSNAPMTGNRSRGEHHGTEQPAYSYSRYPPEESETYDRHAQPSVPSQQGYPSLKRSFSQAEAPAYQEIVQDLRDDGSRMNVNQNHKLLSFRRSQDKHTIVDQHGSVQQFELSAQLLGMFFLSEMGTSPTESSSMQPELTCYRRNLFQISGSLVTPRGPLSVVTESGETSLINTMELTVSAIESVDGNPVRLIVIPWKTPPPNSAEATQGPDQEPASLPLIPFQDDGSETDGDFAVYPIGWRRLQFRIATANNGRRKELQQHFVLHLKVYGQLANNSKVVLTESTTAPIVVRGRSPRNFQARKEIPLLGSSAGSRGQALVESGLGVAAGALSAKQQEAKARGMDISAPPRSAFTFSPPKGSSSQLSSGAIRSNSYPSWTSPSNASIAQLPNSSPGSYPSTTLPSDSYSKLPLSGSSNYTSEPQEIPLGTSMPPPVPLSLVSSDHTQPPMRSPYGYLPTATAQPQMTTGTTTPSNSEAVLSVPRYVDTSRPTKSPRHASHPSIHGSSSVANADAPSDYRYGSYPGVGSTSNDLGPAGYPSDSAAQANAPRDYYPSTGTWTAGAGEHGSTMGYPSGDGRPYPFPQDHFKTASTTHPIKQEPGHSGPSHAYGGAPRGSFDGMNNYSWGSS